jgi:hypothetical protein
MMTLSDLASVPSDPLVPFTDQLRLAVAAYLARFKGSSREHTESDLRCYLAWCAERGLDPPAARRPHLELYIRWMQEIRWFKPSTVSRRFSVAAGFYRTCVLDGALEHSPAEHVRRPAVPPESPTLGFTHLQFGALLTAARQSPDPWRTEKDSVAVELHYPRPWLVSAPEREPLAVPWRRLPHSTPNRTLAARHAAGRPTAPAPPTPRPTPR